MEYQTHIIHIYIYIYILSNIGAQTIELHVLETQLQHSIHISNIEMYPNDKCNTIRIRKHIYL